MVDKWFFDDDILRLEARALVKAANRAAHSQPVHDCRLLILSDDFRLLVQIRTVCIGVFGTQHQDQHQMDTKRTPQQGEVQQRTRQRIRLQQESRRPQLSDDRGFSRMLRSRTLITGCFFGLDLFPTHD